MRQHNSEMTREAKRRIGARLKQAAHEAGLNGAAVNRAMGLGKGTAYKWFKGEDLPAPARMEEFGTLVGKPVSWFYGEEYTDKIAQYAKEALLDICMGVMQGSRPGESWDRVTAEPRFLSPIERREVVDAAEQPIRERIRAAIPSWSSLPPQKQREQLGAIVDELLARFHPEG